MEPEEDRNQGDFKNRLQQQYKRYDLWQVRYNTKGLIKANKFYKYQIKNDGRFI